MSKQWPKVKLGELLRHRKEFITIDDLTNYKRPRVQLHVQGIVLRDDVPGALIKTKTQQVCRAGEFLVAEIDAKVGGFGIVPESLNGSIVSSHYFLFVIDEAKLNRRFLDFFIRTPTFREQVAAQGSTNYAAIRPAHVLGYEIPLPPLAEQRRVVARIEELAAQIHEASTLRHQAAEEAEALLVSFRRAAFGEVLQPDWIPLSNYVERIMNGKSPATEGRPAASDEWAVLKVGAVSFGVFDERENKALPISYIVPPSMEVRPGDFIMSRANTVELVGACALVRKTRPKLMLSDKTFRFVFREPRKVVPEFMEQVLKSPPLREQIERSASGTSPTMKNISKEKVLALRLPPFALPEQRQIVAELDTLQAEVDALNRLQAEVSAELDALLPAILDRAGKGEL
jgi:type I restriction enzyme, S subunit